MSSGVAPSGAGSLDVWAAVLVVVRNPNLPQHLLAGVVAVAEVVEVEASGAASGVATEAVSVVDEEDSAVAVVAVAVDSAEEETTSAAVEAEVGLAGASGKYHYFEVRLVKVDTIL